MESADDGRRRAGVAAERHHRDEPRHGEVRGLREDVRAVQPVCPFLVLRRVDLAVFTFKIVFPNTLQAAVSLLSKYDTRIRSGSPAEPF